LGYLKVMLYCRELRRLRKKVGNKAHPEGSDDDEMEMTESDNESENQREFRDMGDGNNVNHDDVIDSDSDSE
jgi:hypothetical protein